MNLKRLEAFYWAAKLRSCSKAAERLLVTQPAVTMQIRELERTYKIRLFRRIGNQIELTEAGRTLYSYAQRIFGLAEEAEERLLELGRIREEVLRLGTTRTYARCVLPPLISVFQQENPRVKVILKEGGSLQLLEDLMASRQDLVIAAPPRPPRNVQSLPFREEEIFVVVSRNHPWFEREEVSIKELRDQILVVREKGSATRSAVSKLFRKYGLKATVSLEGEDAEFIKEMLKGGDKVSFFVLPSIEKEVTQGWLKPLRLKEERLFLEVKVFFLAEDLSPPARGFLQILSAPHDGTSIKEGGLMPPLFLRSGL
ncbi:MAG TPA: LysR family transcriptional regulator [Deltaproteobacteria bacterium]|nr:LysR family transcriptional regulator [Deltaproteobacteria bacterium]